jgi:hypothetical protein
VVFVTCNELSLSLSLSLRMTRKTDDTDIGHKSKKHLEGLSCILRLACVNATSATLSQLCRPIAHAFVQSLSDWMAIARS